MNLHRLRIFYYVAQFESVTQAAEALHVSQPAVTAQIKKFEDELGVTLFQPVGRGVRLTSIGRDLYTGSQELFAVETKLKHLVHQAQGTSAPHLRIASNLLGMEKILPPYLAAFKRTYPEFPIQLATLNSTDALQAVVAGDADFGISGSHVTTLSQLDSAIIYDDRLVFVASPEHPLAGQPVSLATLGKYPFVGREKDSYTHQRLARLFHSQRLADPHFSAIFNYSQGALAATQAGRGVHFCSYLLVETALATGELIELQVTDVSQAHPLYVSWLRQRVLTGPLQAFRDLLVGAQASP